MAVKETPYFKGLLVPTSCGRRSTAFEIRDEHNKIVGRMVVETRALVDLSDVPQDRAKFVDVQHLPSRLSFHLDNMAAI
ncbi:MAG: hypothetical protein SWH78_04315 [Thermodesulfobacteriota bacterium]|nr:hypothetical protein [Thermodesulfobacteriota bacterium]